MHLAYLLKFCITVSCFQFLLGVTVGPREIKDKGYAIFVFLAGEAGGGGGETKCIMVYVEVGNCIDQQRRRLVTWLQTKNKNTLALSDYKDYIYNYPMQS